jgi:hypothetical protein
MMNRTMIMASAGAAGVLAFVLGCGGNAVASGTGGGGAADEVPAVFRRFAGTVEVSADGDEIVLRSNDVPDHGSPYFPVGDPRHQAYDGSNPAFRQNPFQIREQQLVIRIPRNPRRAASSSPTPLGPIGMAVNGVAIFNQYAGGGRPLTDEINGFDQHNGHPQQTGAYHYHAEPFHLTRTRGSGALIGFLLDGFPVYGPVENGRRVTNADLDDLHGHMGATADYPNGIYHYHVTAEDPYINGAGFYGVPGTASR